jgi:hypothetical protein
MDESYSVSDNDNDNDYITDLSWIADFEKIDKEYKDFYAEDLSYIQLHIVYLNKQSDIIKIKEEKTFMKKPNYLSREEVLRIIKSHYINDSIKYSVLSILKYNITLSPLNLKSFLKSTDKHIGFNYLTPIHNIDAIHFERTISILQDLNDVFIIFYQKPETNLNTKTNPDFNTNSDFNTNTSLNTNASRQNVTKRIYFSPMINRNKTFKKRFKDDSLI